MPTIYQLSAVVRILILLALCGLSNAQMLDVDDFCDFAGYDGICLEASKCTDLQAKMQALTLESHHVGRCGFGVREEIICCPKWQTPVQTPPKLPNAFIDLSKQPEFEYKSPLDGALSDSSILSTTSTPINFQQNGNNFQEHVQDEEDRLKLLFNGNFGQAGSGNNVREWKGVSAPAVNENNNGFFIANPVPNIQDNQNLNGNPVVDENERFNAIFGNGNDNSPDEKKANSFPVVNENNNGFFIANPVPNVQDNQNLNGNPAVDENERMNAIFSVNREQIGNNNSQDEKKANSFPVVNENNNGFFIANPLPNVQDNQNLNSNPAVDENERMNAIFGNNHEQIGNDNSQDEKKANSFPVVNENNNGFISGTPVPTVQDNQDLNGNPVVDKNERINAIFSVNAEQIGSDNSQDENKVNSFPVVNENNNGFFIANPLPNIQGNQLNGYPVIDENDRLNAIFGDNSPQNGNENSQDEKKGNENSNGFFIANPVPNVQDNQNVNGNPTVDENERMNAIFGNNHEQIGNENSQDEKKGNSLPVENKNNNGFFIANPVVNLQNNQNLNGNPAVDENERMNAIFGNNLEHNRNDESKEETKTNPVPFVNGNNNGFFSATPVPNVQGNGEFIGNPVIDANERVKAVFDNNPVQVGSDNSKDEGKVNPLLLVNGNNNGIFNQNPIPNVEGYQKLNGNPVIDENERFNALFNPLPIDDDRVRPSGVIDQDSAENLKAKINAIFGGNREQVGNANDNAESKGYPVPVINGNNNTLFNQNSISNVQNNQKFNGNPFFDENERFKALFNGNPGKSGSVSSIGKWKGNIVPVIAENNNGLFNENPVSNIQANRKANGNPFFDENERFNAIFNGNSIPKEKHIGGLNGVISQNPAIFGGKSVQLEDTNNSGELHGKPFPSDDELIHNNAAMVGKGILDEKALINAILKGQLESSAEHFIFNDKPLRARPINRRRHSTFMENRSTFNNGHFNMRNHRRFEEATHRRSQGVYRGSNRNTRIRFANN